MAIQFASSQRLLRSTSGISATLFSCGFRVLWTAFPASAAYSNVVSRNGNAICAFNQAGTVKLDLGTASDWTGSALSLNRWYDVIYTRGEATNIHKVYLNGALDITSTADTAAGTQIAVGSYGAALATDFTGLIENLWFMDGVALTASDARHIYQSGRPDLVANLAAWYRFESPATQLVDSSGNNRPLTLDLGTTTAGGDAGSVRRGRRSTRVAYVAGGAAAFKTRRTMGDGFGRAGTRRSAA